MKCSPLQSGKITPLTADADKLAVFLEMAILGRQRPLIILDARAEVAAKQKNLLEKLASPRFTIADLAEDPIGQGNHPLFLTTDAHLHSLNDHAHNTILATYSPIFRFNS